MLQKNLNKWALSLKLWEVEWGLTNTQSTFWLHKQKNIKHNLIFTNWIAKYDFAYGSTSKHSWEYYYRRSNETRLLLEWHRFVALWQRVKWKRKRISMLLYTDIFDDYPLIKHLGKKTNESYSVGWYPGLTSNRRKLLKFQYSYLLGKTEILILPSVVILFSAFYSITQHFLKELGNSNTYYIFFVSLGDYQNVVTGSYTIFMSKNYTNYYYYYHLIYTEINGQLSTQGVVGYQSSLLRKFMKTQWRVISRKKYFLTRFVRFRVFKQQLKLNWYRRKEIKQQKQQKIWNTYLSWLRVKRIFSVTSPERKQMTRYNRNKLKKKAKRLFLHFLMQNNVENTKYRTKNYKNVAARHFFAKTKTKFRK